MSKHMTYARFLVDKSFVVEETDEGFVIEVEFEEAPEWRVIYRAVDGMNDPYARVLMEDLAKKLTRHNVLNVAIKDAR